MHVVLADLGHNQVTISSDVFPLGIANLAAYAQEKVRSSEDIRYTIVREPQALKDILDDGEPLTVIELVDEILTIMQKSSLEPIIMNEASNEIVNQYLDCSKAQKLLGWQPRFNRIDGLRETVAWYEDYIFGRDRGRQNVVENLISGRGI